MSTDSDLNVTTPDHVFDGGDLDCGSGLALLIRENMLQTPIGGILEIKSREPTVREDLPPWCRLSGHEYLGAIDETDHVRYLVKRGAGTEHDKKALQEDMADANNYVWRARSRVTGPLTSTVYCRNFSFSVGQPASFEEKDKNPSAVEYLLGAVAGAIATGFASECSRDNLDIDDIEIVISGRLKSVLAHLGMEEGDPSFESIKLKCFASTMEDEGQVMEAWNRTVVRSPLATTLEKALDLTVKLVVVM